MEKLLEGIAEFVNKCLGPLGADDFTPDAIRDLIIQLFATLILFLVVKKFFWSKITNLLEARRDAIDEELTKAQEANAKAALLQEKLDGEYEKSKLEIQTLIANAVKEGNVLKDEIVTEAKKEAELRLANATKDIEYEIKKQQNNIKEEIISIAFAAAEKIVAKEVDQKKHLKVVTDLIESGLGK
ncbi:MAG: F0F1 ATP synthase subunit B [bacterium]